jgi:hypothetical protein
MIVVALMEILWVRAPAVRGSKKDWLNYERMLYIFTEVSIAMKLVRLIKMLNQNL